MAISSHHAFLSPLPRSVRLSILSFSSASALTKRLTPSPGWERAGVWDLSAWRRFLAPGIKILRRGAEKRTSRAKVPHLSLSHPGGGGSSDTLKVILQLRRAAHLRHLASLQRASR